MNADVLGEVEETFTVELSNAVNGTIGDGTGTATILDDDQAPSLFIDDVTVREAQRRRRARCFTVWLSAPSGQEIAVDCASSDGTALAGGL